MVAEVRNLVRSEFRSVRLGLRQIERSASMQLQCQEITNDTLERVLRRLVRLERVVGLVEAPSEPRISWRQLLGRE